VQASPTSILGSGPIIAQRSKVGQERLGRKR